MPKPRRLPVDFSASAAYPLFAFDPVQDRVWVLHFAPEDYRRASFLDRRALSPDMAGWEVSGAELEAAIAGTAAAVPVHWLFHIGHCGSSLVSRLLDQLPGVLGLREPLPLLALAHGRGGPVAEAWLTPVVRLLARGFDDTAAVVVKPTSVVNTLAELLLAQGPGRACLLWVDLHTWLATMLRDDGLVAATLATEALRLAGPGLDGFDRVGASRERPGQTAQGADWPALTQTQAHGNAQRLARLWLAEQLRWRRLGADPRFAGCLLELDFARVLADPGGCLAVLAAHYGLPVPEDLDARIAESGLLERYAKDPRQAFDAQQRERELASARERHAAPIAGAMAWAENALSESDDQTALQPRLRPRTTPSPPQPFLPSSTA